MAEIGKPLREWENVPLPIPAPVVRPPEKKPETVPVPAEPVPVGR